MGRGRAAATAGTQGRGHRTQPRGRRPRRERAGVVAGWRVLGVGRGCSGVAGAGGIRWSHRRRQGLGATAGAVRGHGAVSAQRTRLERVNRGRARRGPRRRARAREGEEGSKAGLTSGGVGHGQWGLGEEDVDARSSRRRATGSGVQGDVGSAPSPIQNQPSVGGRWEGGLRRRALGGGGDGERRRGDGDGPIRSGSDERERRGSGEVVAVVGSGGVRVSGQGVGWPIGQGMAGWATAQLGQGSSGGGLSSSFFFVSFLFWFCVSFSFYLFSFCF